MSDAYKRVGQIAGHLNYPQGMLAGQVAIITGSGQGIGAEAARLFANEGAKVVVSDIDAGWSSLINFSLTNLIAPFPSKSQTGRNSNQLQWWLRH